MHNHLVNAAIQFVPLSTTQHPYEWVDEAIAVIAHSGLRYEVGAFATTVEGTYAQVMQLFNSINEHFCTRGCTEWVINLQLGMRCDRDCTIFEKTAKHQQTAAAA